MQDVDDDGLISTAQQASTADDDVCLRKPSQNGHSTAEWLLQEKYK